jgi:diguanylate cyclase (GGDEF)-like protein
VARYGGEEFVLVLPETDAAGAKVVAERIREKIEAARTPIEGGAPVGVTVSFGCATTRTASTGAELLAAADRALYAAKRGGRNRVEAAEDRAEAAPAPGAWRHAG